MDGTVKSKGLDSLFENRGENVEVLPTPERRSTFRSVSVKTSRTANGVWFSCFCLR